MLSISNALPVSENAKKIKKQRGMTLIEIMVVLAIIGIISAFVGVKVIKFLDDAKVDTTKVQMKGIMQALDLYKSKHNVYPNTEQGLEALVQKPTAGKIPDNYPPDGYMPNVPKDGWGNEFEYVSPGTGRAYEIISRGADGQEGGESYAADIKSFELEAR